MEKILYSKPEIETIELELQSPITTSPSETLDPSDTTDGEFDSNRKSFWNE